MRGVAKATEDAFDEHITGAVHVDGLVDGDQRLACDLKDPAGILND